MGEDFSPADRLSLGSRLVFRIEYIYMEVPIPFSMGGGNAIMVPVEASTGSSHPPRAQRCLGTTSHQRRQR